MKMAQTMAPPPGGPPQGAPPQGGPPQEQEDGGPEDLLKALDGIQKALMSLLEGMKGSAPPEALKLLQTASDSFNQFMAMIGGKGGQAPGPSAPPAQADSMAGQNPNARPVG